MNFLTNDELDQFEANAKNTIEDLSRSIKFHPLSDHGKRELWQAERTLDLIPELRLYRGINALEDL